MPDTTLRDAWRELATKALGVIPVRVAGVADSTDATNLIKDFEFIHMRCLGPLLCAYAEFAKENFSAFDPDEFEQFIGFIQDAFSELRGHLIDVEQRLMEDEADRACDPRGWSKAQELGVD
jgi:hypothetical protein